MNLKNFLVALFILTSGWLLPAYSYMCDSIEQSEVPGTSGDGKSYVLGEITE